MEDNDITSDWLEMDVAVDSSSCPFCNLNLIDDLDDHIRTCPRGLELGVHDKLLVLLNTELDRLKNLHIELFSRLLVNDPIPVKNDISNVCFSCTSLDEHLQGKCRLMSRVEAFDLVVAKLHFSEVTLKMRCANVHYNKIMDLARLSTELEYKELDECCQKTLAVRGANLTARAMRRARRDVRKELTRQEAESKLDLERLEKICAENRDLHQTLVETSVHDHIQRIRALVMSVDQTFTINPMVRIVSST